MSLITLKKIISGGQSGVDRAALDVALKYNISCGGWCPKGRRAEDGPIEERYPLQEAEDEKYETRTRLNVLSSDATLILFQTVPDKGTILTKELTKVYAKPLLEVDLKESWKYTLQKTMGWLENHQVKTLNIAGPRESNSPGVYSTAFRFLERLVTFDIN